MIRTYRDKISQQLLEGRAVGKGLPAEVQRRARIKLLQLNNAQCPEDLAIPPGNRLEKLHGDRRSYYSIRVNGQWRICFRFVAGEAHEVELVDYH